MIGGSRRVQPQQQRLADEKILDFDPSRWDSSSDGETISSFAYTFRKVITGNISRNFDKSEIDLIEKRFEDTSRVIYKDLEQLNRSLLRKSFKRPLRSDIIAIDGIWLTSPPPPPPPANDSLDKKTEDVHFHRKIQVPGRKLAVPTIENVWQGEPKPTPSELVVNQAKQTNQSRPGKNAVSPAPQTNQKSSTNRRKGICRVQ